MKHSGVIFLLAPGISQTEKQRVPHHPQIFVRMPSPLQHPAYGGLAAVRMAWFRGCTVLRGCNHCIGYVHPAPPAPQILSFAFAREERLPASRMCYSRGLSCIYNHFLIDRRQPSSTPCAGVMLPTPPTQKPARTAAGNGPQHPPPCSAAGILICPVRLRLPISCVPST